VFNKSHIQNMFNISSSVTVITISLDKEVVDIEAVEQS
jgi:hypothetical protein